MDSPLSREDETSFTLVIDSILAGSDINTVSAKKIRLQLQQGLGRDVTHQKKAINELIQRRFDTFTANQDVKAVPVANGTPACNPPPPSPPPASTNANGPAVKPDSPVKAAAPVKREKPEDAVEDDAAPAKKKPKKSEIDEDAAYAAKLQAQFNNAARPTRGGGARPTKPVVKKKPAKAKRKSAAKITADDDSEVNDEAGDDSKPSRRGGKFNKPMWLSQPLQELLGVETLSRPQTVKGLWNYIRENELQDPSNKRRIRCDDKFRAVFRKDAVDMFSMNKILSSHLSPTDDD